MVVLVVCCLQWFTSRSTQLSEINVDRCLMDPASFCDFQEAIQSANLEKVSTLLTTNPNLLNAQDDHGMCALCWAAYFDEPEVAKYILTLRQQRGGELATIWGKDKHGATAIHHAALNGSLRTLRMFKEFQAPWCATNEWGETCLHVAIGFKKDQEAVSVLLAADPALASVKDNWGRLAFDVTAVDSSPATGAPAHSPSVDLKSNLEAEFMKLREQWSTRSRKVNIVEKGMFSTNQHASISQPTGTPKQKIPLSKIVEYPGDPKAIAQALSQADKYDPRGRDMYKLTALHKFSSWDKPDLITLLLPHLPADDILLRGGDVNQTSIEMAIEMRAWRSLELLLNHSSTTRSCVEELLRIATANSDTETKVVLEKRLSKFS